MLQIKYTARPYLQKRNGIHSLCWRIRWNGNTLVKYIGYQIDIDKWSSDSHRCKSGTIHGDASHRRSATSINRDIQTLDDATFRIFDLFGRDNVVPTKEQVDVELCRAIGMECKSSRDESFRYVYNIFVREMSVTNAWRDKSIEAMLTASDRVCDYRPSLNVSEMNENFLKGFMEFLCSRSYSNSTIISTLHKIKQFCTWCNRNGYLEDAGYRNFTMKIKDGAKNIVFLDLDEIIRIYNHDFADYHMSYVRDMFCLSAFTSLRSSDIMGLRWEQIYDDRIHVTTVKTSKSVVIELNAYSREILARHRNDMDNGYVFFRMLEPTVNRYVRSIAKECGIDKPFISIKYISGKRIERTVPKYEVVTFHAARRTFISNSLALGISPNVIMKWTGHSNYNSMKPYIDIADKTKEEAMSKFDCISGNSVAKKRR